MDLFIKSLLDSQKSKLFLESQLVYSNEKLPWLPPEKGTKSLCFPCFGENTSVGANHCMLGISKALEAPASTRLGHVGDSRGFPESPSSLGEQKKKGCA